MLPIKKLQEKLSVHVGLFHCDVFAKFVEEHNIEVGNTTIPYVFPRWMIRKHLQTMSLAEDIVFYAARTEFKQLDFKSEDYGCSKIWDHMIVMIGADMTEYVTFSPAVTKEAAEHLVADIAKLDYMDFITRYVNIKVYDAGEAFWNEGRLIVFEVHEK